MEGYLNMWTGVLTQWRRFYFILHHDTITFCSQKGGQKEGSIHLKVASTVSVIDDPLKINIHTGTHILFIRAGTVKQRIQWMKAFASAQHDILSHDLSMQMRKLESDGAKEYDVTDKKVKSLEGLVAELWNLQAQLEEILAQLMPKLQRNTSSRLCDKIIQITNNIKYKTSQALNLIQKIKVSLRQKPTLLYKEGLQIQSTQDTHQRLVHKSILPPSRSRNNLLSNGSVDQFRSFDRGADQLGEKTSIDQYQSFDNIPGNGTSLQRINQITDESDYMSFDRTQAPVSLKLLRRASEENDSSYKQFGQSLTPPLFTKKVSPYNMDDRCSHKYKNNLVNRNLAFIQYPVSRETYRSCLPISVEPELKINIMSVLKDSIGADLTKVSFPVSLNEPLSVLQKGCEQMFYSFLLDKASLQSDPLQRLLNVVAFAVSQYSLTINKTKKPFNPLLGETFQYVDSKRRFKYLAQQVSHHPPVSAMQCSSDNYSYFSNSKGQTNFRGASIKMAPGSHCRVVLKKSRDVIVFNRCVTSLNNLIVGNIYVDNYGDVTFKMYNNGQIVASSEVKFLESSMWGNTQYKVAGIVRDSGGRECKVEGRWNQSLFCTEIGTGISTQIWSLTHQSLADNYYFNQMATDLNNLNYGLLDLIAPTDSRLRPDQRALQNGNKQLAATEKHRLEQQQRQKKKTVQARDTHHVPVWFEEIRVPESGEMEWVSNDKYWEERKVQNWTHCPQLY